jgi:hypothetical protein
VIIFVSLLIIVYAFNDLYSVLLIYIFFPRENSREKSRDASSHSWMEFLTNTLVYISVPKPFIFGLEAMLEGN